jgi:hypothetical protein
MTIVGANTLVGVSATTLPTRRNCATEAKRTANALDDPWAVKLFGFIVAIDCDYSGAGADTGRQEETYQMDFSS